MALESLFKNFPPPQFMVMPAIGIDMSEMYIRFLDFSLNGNKRSIRRYGEKKVPPGAIVNGEIMQPETLIPILKGIAKETGSVLVRASLPEEKTYVFKTELPHLPMEAIGSAVEFKIQENVPISPAEALFDYSVVYADAERTHVSVTVVPQTVVAAYTDVFKAAGLMPISFKVQSQTVARAIIQNGEMATALIVHVMDKKIGFYVASNGVVQFSSNIRVNTKPTLDVSVVNDEIAKVNAYWRNYTAKNDMKGDTPAAIQKILLCGNPEGVAVVEKELARSAVIPVELANVWGNAFDLKSYIPEMPMNEALVYAPAIGLALGIRTQHV